MLRSPRCVDHFIHHRHGIANYFRTSHSDILPVDCVLRLRAAVNYIARALLRVSALTTRLGRTALFAELDNRDNTGPRRETLLHNPKIFGSR
jgi:hypothetical protein